MCNDILYVVGLCGYFYYQPDVCLTIAARLTYSISLSQGHYELSLPLSVRGINEYHSMGFLINNWEHGNTIDLFSGGILSE